VSRHKWSANKNFHSSLNIVGRCEEHNKITYRTRKAARKAARSHQDDHKSTYPCEISGLWHVGGLSRNVISGEVERSVIYNLGR